jgi:serine protease Do
MINPRSTLKGALCARRVILLATATNLALAVLLVGPGGSGQSVLPTFSTANAAESATPVSHGWMGVQIQPVTSDIADSLGMKESKGALVAESLADSPAAKAGILSGDIITALNDNQLKDAHDLVKQVAGMAPGDTVKLTIWRKEAEKSISLTLGEMPKAREARAEVGANGTEVPKLGLLLASAEHVAGGGSEGVIVVDIDPTGLASEHGFKTGDIILDATLVERR